LLDPGFSLVLVHPTPAMMPRARWLDVLPDYVVHSYDRQAHAVDVDGDCGVAVQRAHMSATVLGEDRSGLFVISDAWRLRDGTWRLWRRHSTPLAAGRMPGTDTPP
jgi:hypothetical protein